MQGKGDALRRTDDKANTGLHRRHTPYAAACAAVAMVPLVSVAATVPAALFFPAPGCYAAASALNFIFLLAMCGYAFYRRGCGIGQSSDAMGVFFGVACMFCFYPGSMLVSRAAGALFPVSRDSSGAYAGGTLLDFGVPAAWVLIAFLPGICEELLCRGLLYTALRKHGVLFACLWSAACFAAMHGSLQQAAYAFYFGVVIAALREATGSVVPCMACHIAFNSVGVLYQAIPRPMPSPGAFRSLFLEQNTLLVLAVGLGAIGFWVLFLARKHSWHGVAEPVSRPGPAAWLLPAAAFLANAAYGALSSAI